MAMGNLLGQASKERQGMFMRVIGRTERWKVEENSEIKVEVY